jgi:threonylcarbamoyladenosine tRNA methylthiotransferase MtaB
MTALPDAPTQPRTVAFVTQGCKTNLMESSALAHQFSELGWQLVPQHQPASLYVINTCTVTQRADAEARRLIRQLKLKAPQAKVATTGCYAQVAPAVLAAMPDVDFVIGNSHKDQLPQLLHDYLTYPNATTRFEKLGATTPVWVDEFDKSRTLAHATGALAGFERSRAALKIQDGCDYKCTYCIIWQGRGPSRSLPLAQARDALWRLVDDGHQEITLTGINIGQYRFVDEATGNVAELPELLQALVSLPASAQYRLRLTSLDPLEVTPQLIDVMASHPQRIAPHLHLSTQSAEDGVLKAMARRHHVADLDAVVAMATTALPDVALTGDVIAGFPTESDAAFERSLAVLAGYPLHSLHVFRFSPRQGTPAAALRPQVPERIRKERAGRLIALSNQKQAAYYQHFVGERRPVLLEHPSTEATHVYGVTDNALRIALPIEHFNTAALVGGQLAHLHLGQLTSEDEPLTGSPQRLVLTAGL